jgi:hypothetical protein
MKLSFLLASSLVWLGLSCTSKADLITVRFGGTVNAVRVIHRVDRPELREIDFPEIGDLFTGYYTFDSSLHDLAPEANHGLWYNVLSENAISVTIGEFAFRGNGLAISTSADYYSVSDWIPSLELISDQPLPPSRYAFNFSLNVFRDGLFSDPNILPNIPPSLDSAMGGLSLSMRDSLDLSPASPLAISVSLDYLTIVPEPSCMYLVMVSGVLLLPHRGRLRNYLPMKDR